MLKIVIKFEQVSDFGHSNSALVPSSHDHAHVSIQIRERTKVFCAFENTMEKTAHKLPLSSPYESILEYSL